MRSTLQKLSRAFGLLGVLGAAGCTPAATVERSASFRMIGYQLPETCQFMTFEARLRQPGIQREEGVTVDHSEPVADFGAITGIDFGQPVAIRIRVTGQAGQCAPYSFKATWRETKTLTAGPEGTYVLQLAEIRKVREGIRP